jgi:putative endonuclease
MFDKIYVGQTNNLNDRIIQHNEAKVTSTKHYIPWELVYFEKFKTRSEAMKREKELKSHKGRETIREKYKLVRVRQLPD